MEFEGSLGYVNSCLKENSFFKKSPANIESFHHQELETHLCLPSTTEVNNATMFCYHDVPTSQQDYRTEGHRLWSPWNHKLNNFLLLKGKNEMERQGWEEREGGLGGGNISRRSLFPGKLVPSINTLDCVLC